MPTVQIGGMISSFQNLMNNMDSPVKLLYGVVLLLLVVYSPVVPSEYKTFADSLLGRVLGIAIIYGVVESMGWVYGLLTALAFLLLISGAPRDDFNLQEGFDGGGTVSEKKIVGKRWFVEKVLGERPNKIATDRVLTTAIESYK